MTNFQEQSHEEFYDEASAMIAQYKDHELPEFQNNPMIDSLPPIAEDELAISKSLLRVPHYNQEERNYRADLRFHCVERLSRYFYPQSQSITLHRLVNVLMIQGYLGRNPLRPEYAHRTRQINKALKAINDRKVNKENWKLEDYINIPSSASSLSLAGLSGIGKTTNLNRILSEFDRVIYHPKYITYQIPWLKVDCPSQGSLKNLCYFIFKEMDGLLGTDYFEKNGKKNYTEEYLLAKLAQLLHLHHVGLLVIDEIQNLNHAPRNKNQLLNFLVTMDNCIGVPVIRVGTNDMIELIGETLRNARRAGIFIQWDRMVESDYQYNEENGRKFPTNEWHFCIERIWKYQWTKTPVDFTVEFGRVFYELTQGIYDIAIKLYKMVQWQVIACGGTEEITVDLIRQVARMSLKPVQPMLDYLRFPEKYMGMEFRDIGKVNIGTVYTQSELQLNQNLQKELDKIAEEQQNSQEELRHRQHIVRKLLSLELGISAELAAFCAGKVYNKRKARENLQALVNEACQLALGGQVRSPRSKPHTELSEDPKDEMGRILEEAEDRKQSAYEALKLAGIVENPGQIQDFFSSDKLKTS